MSPVTKAAADGEPPYKSVEERLREALSKAPRDPENPPPDGLTEGMPRALGIAGGWGGDEPTMRRNHHLDASTAVTRKELAKVRKLAEDLIVATDELHKPAVALIGDWMWGRPKLSMWLHILVGSIEHANIPAMPPKKGRRPDPRSAKVASVLVYFWPMLTGRRATITVRSLDNKATGSFLNVLTEVFQILKITASPESQGRAAIDKGENYPA